ncbi:MAG: DUF3604 domain-containing protein [Terriglobia bacterium]
MAIKDGPSRRQFLKVGATGMFAGVAGVPHMPGGTSFSDAVASFPLAQDNSGGAVTVNPSEGLAGAYGTWTVTYQVGRNGIRQHGGICVQLPDAWAAGIRNSANRLQASDPSGDNYISGRCSRAEVRLRTIVDREPSPEEVLVKSNRVGLDGRYARHIYVIRVWVTEGELQEGDMISVLYGDISGGSKGMRASIMRTHPEPILLAVDYAGTGNFQMHPDHPTLIAHAGPPAEILLWGPSTLVEGREAELKLAAVDVNSNPAPFDGEVELRIKKGKAKLPARVKFQSSDGWMTIPFTPLDVGIIRIEARVTQEKSMLNPRPIVPRDMASGIVAPVQVGTRVIGNPMKVFAHEPKLKIYWGELHSHTHYSYDAAGHDSFRYARYVSGLDFYAMTDHAMPTAGKYRMGLGVAVWEEYKAETEKYYDPGRFVTLYAYECSFGAPFGHHNVFFRGKPNTLFLSGDMEHPGNGTLPDLWKALQAGEALTIPHHTGKFPRPIYWYPHNPEIDRNIEIFSAHGLSETYNPRGPLAFERMQFTNFSTSAPGPQYAQDAWIQGLKLSTIASTDDHRAHPAQPSFGRAAVAATGLTREEIFDGLHGRRTYGTTGVGILLDFSINGEPMGSQISATNSPELEVEAHGTDDIEFIQVLRYSKSDGAFLVIHTLFPEGPDFTWRQADTTFQEDSVYYVRLRQARLVRTRVAMAWSSPIWVKRSG